MRVVIAPDSFKECLGAAQVAAAIGAGVLTAQPQAVVDVCPMADGGPGTVEAMVAATGGRFVTADVFDALGASIRARFGILGERPVGAVLPGEVGLSAAGPSEDDAGSCLCEGGCTAIVEMAAASGLELVPPEMRDPLVTTTFGTGQLMLAALDAGATEMIVALGGSATVDGGCGAAQALGVTFKSAQGGVCMCGLGGGGLRDIAGIDLSTRDPRVVSTRIRAACDVQSPLTGLRGAAAVFGPQKGATPETVERLEAGLKHLCGVIRRDCGMDVESLPGAGAAGGLGAGLAAFAGARLEHGFELVSAAVGLARRLRGADLCITGEGRLDGSSAAGKTTVGVAALARRMGVPVACVCGQMGDGAPAGDFDMICPLAEQGIAVRQAMQRAEELLKVRAAQAVRRLRG